MNEPALANASTEAHACDKADGNCNHDYGLFPQFLP